MAIARDEVSGSPRESYGDGGFKANAEFICKWEERHDLAHEIMGGGRLVGTTMVRDDPERYPFFLEAFAQDIEIEPLANSKVLEADPAYPGRCRYEKATVRVTYAVPPYRVVLTGSATQGKDWVTETIEPSAEFITLPGQKCYWDTSQNEELADNEGPGFIVRMMEWCYTRHKLISIPPEIFTMVGAINETPVKSPTLKGILPTDGFPAKTLLYNPPRITRVVLADGTTAYDVEMRFSYRTDDWNLHRKAGAATASGSYFIWKPQAIYNASGEQVSLYIPKEFNDTLVIPNGIP